MSSYISMSSLKRSRRTRTRKPSSTTPCPSSSSSGNALQIIPEASEEEDCPQSCASEHRPSPLRRLAHKASRSLGDLPSMDSESSSGSVYRQYRTFDAEDSGLADSRRSMASEDDFLLFSTPPRPAPRPPTSSSPSRRSALHSRACSLDRGGSPLSSPLHVTFAGDLCLDFPRPPSAASSPGVSSSSTRSKRARRNASVFSIPSIYSTDIENHSHYTSSPSSDSSDLPMTPTTSDDDEDFVPSRRSLPHRVSIKPLFFPKSASEDPHEAKAPSSPASLFFQSPGNAADSLDEIEEATEWYSQQFSEILTICSPIPPSFPSRPESMALSSALAPGRAETRIRRPLPAPPAQPPTPSPQLDPAYPRRKNAPSYIPRRAPPPPPVVIAPAPAARRDRPPPRVSVPADVGVGDAELALSPMGGDADSASASASSGSVYSQDSVFEVELAFGDDAGLDAPLRLPVSIPTSPLDLDAEVMLGLDELLCEKEDPQAMSPAAPETPMGEMYVYPEVPPPSKTPPSAESAAHEPALRSRWSTSTLGSLRDARAPESASSKILHFAFGARRSRGKSVARPLSPLLSPTVEPKVLPRGPAPGDGRVRGPSGRGERALRRSGSRSSSSAASDSGDSTASSGLRRKPIPVELLIKCAQ